MAERSVAVETPLWDPMVKDALLRLVGWAPWEDLCRELRSLSASQRRELEGVLMHKGGRGQVTDSTQVGWVLLASVYDMAVTPGPVVTYRITPEIWESVRGLSLPKFDGTWEDLLRAPYPIMSLVIPGWNSGWIVKTLKDDDPQGGLLHLHTRDGGFCVWGHEPVDLNALQTYGRVTPEDVAGVVNLLLFLTHSDDFSEKTRNYKKEVKTKSRNKKPITFKVVDGVVGGGFSSSLRSWRPSPSEGASSERSTLRPHCRAAHWHLYWTGSGRTVPKLRFLHPCLVNATTVSPDTQITRKVSQE